MPEEKPYIPRDSQKLVFVVVCVGCGLSLALIGIGVLGGLEEVRWPMVAVSLALPAASGAPLLNAAPVRRAVTALAWLTVFVAVLIL